MKIGDLVKHKRGRHVKGVIKGLGIVIGKVSKDTWRIHWLCLNSVVAHHYKFIEVIDESR